MKKLQAFVFSALVLLITATAFADSIDPAAESLKKPLNLNDKQLKELDKIFTESRTKAQALSKQIAQVNKQRQDRIDAVLNPEQRKKYQEMQEIKFPEDSKPPQMMMEPEPEQKQPKAK